jgi:hypothetical protein
MLYNLITRGTPALNVPIASIFLGYESYHVLEIQQGILGVERGAEDLNIL